MKLLTQELRTKIPALRSTERQRDPVVIAKFFAPWSSWTWYVLEYDGEDTFFGLVHGFEKELGSFSLSELQSVSGPYGLKIERDLFWQPTHLSQVDPETWAKIYAKT